MTTTSESVGKSKGNGSRQQVRASDESDPPLANSDCLRGQMIAEAVYFRAEQRGFRPGDELGDWLQAGAELDGKHGY